MDAKKERRAVTASRPFSLTLPSPIVLPWTSSGGPFTHAIVASAVRLCPSKGLKERAEHVRVPMVKTPIGVVSVGRETPRVRLDRQIATLRLGGGR